MLLVYGTACITLSVLLFTVSLLGARNPNVPGWANDFMIGNIYVPVVITLGVVGLGCYLKLFFNLAAMPLNVFEMAVSIGIAAACVVIVKAINVKKRLAAFEASTPRDSGGKPIRIHHAAKADGTDKPPVKPRSHKKAA